MSAANSFVTDVINLKAYNFSEADKIMVMYSREKGLIKAIAKGVKKPKSKLGARMDLLVANTLMLNKGKNLDIISQADSKNTFSKTRKDMDKIFYSLYVTEVVHNFGVEEDPYSKEIYDLLYKTLEMISKSENKVEVMLNVLKFQLKIMNLSGFSVEFETCLGCGRKIHEEEMFFSQHAGGVFCNRCNIVASVKLNHKIRDFLVTLAREDFEEKSEYERKANEKVCAVCFNLLKSYINSRSSKRFKSSDILQEVC